MYKLVKQKPKDATKTVMRRDDYPKRGYETWYYANKSFTKFWKVEKIKYLKHEKIIDHKRYHMHHKFVKKSDAITEAKFVRKRGWYARVVGGYDKTHGHVWAVYKRGKLTKIKTKASGWKHGKKCMCPVCRIRRRG